MPDDEIMRLAVRAATEEVAARGLRFSDGFALAIQVALEAAAPVFLGVERGLADRLAEALRIALPDPDSTCDIGEECGACLGHEVLAAYEEARREL